MHLTFSATISAADTETRTVTGQIVPFGKPGNTSAGPTLFEVGAFTELDPAKVNLYMEHDMTRPVGRAVSFEPTPTGIIGKFKIAETTAGNDLLVEAQEGLRTGFSVGAEIVKHTYKGNVMHIQQANLREVSAVTRPAFRDDSQITKVAAVEAEPEVEETPEISPAAAEEPQPTESEETVSENIVPEVEAAEAPVQAAAPVYTAPRAAGMTSGDYLFHSVQAALGNHESRDLVRAADDSTATNTGLTLPGHLNQFIVNTFASRPAVDALGGSRALPDSGLSFTIPRLGTAPTVAETAEGAGPSETGMTSDYITVAVKKFSGLNRVSFELLDRSAPAFADLLLAEMQKAYAKATDEAVLAKLISGGTAATNQSADWKGLQAFIAKEAPLAYKNTGGDVANVLIANTDWWGEIVGAVDNSDRPVFNAIAPSNAGGSVGIGQPRGTFFGTDLYVDHNISASGLIDDSAFLVAPSAVAIWESPTTQLRVNVLTTGEVELSLYGYMAVEVLKSAGVREFMIA